MRACRVPAALLLGGLIWAATGCKSAATGGPPSFADVVLEGHTQDEIRAAAIKVFTSHFYVTKVSGPDILVFDKSGGTMDNVLYGGWGPGEVTIRVKLYLTTAGSQSYRLAAQAFMVRDVGDTRLEDEQRLSKLRRGPYQKLLNEVKQSLDQPPPPTP